MEKYLKLLESTEYGDVLIGLCLLDKEDKIKDLDVVMHTNCKKTFVVQFDNQSIWVHDGIISFMEVPRGKDGFRYTGLTYDLGEFDYRTKKEG